MPGRDLTKPGYNTLWRMGLLTGGQCTATTKAAKRCKAKAILGGDVCVRHGGDDPRIQQAAEEALRAYVESVVNWDRLLLELATIAYQDLGTVLDDNLRLLPTSKWPLEMTRVIASMKIKGKATAVEVKFIDKLRALELLAIHLNLLAKRVEHTGDLDVVHVLQQGRERVAQARKAREKVGAQPVIDVGAPVTGDDGQRSTTGSAVSSSSAANGPR